MRVWTSARSPGTTGPSECLPPASHPQATRSQQQLVPPQRPAERQPEPWGLAHGRRYPFFTDKVWSPYWVSGSFKPPRPTPFASTDTWDSCAPCRTTTALTHTHIQAHPPAPSQSAAARCRQHRHQPRHMERERQRRGLPTSRRLQHQRGPGDPDFFTRLDRISPFLSPFFPVFCAFSPSRRGGSSEAQAGTQGRETAGTRGKSRELGPSFDTAGAVRRIT